MLSRIRSLESMLASLERTPPRPDGFEHVEGRLHIARIVDGDRGVARIHVHRIQRVPGDQRNVLRKPLPGELQQTVDLNRRIQRDKRGDRLRQQHRNRVVQRQIVVVPQHGAGAVVQPVARHRLKKEIGVARLRLRTPAQEADPAMSEPDEIIHGLPDGLFRIAGDRIDVFEVVGRSLQQISGMFRNCGKQRLTLSVKSSEITPQTCHSFSTGKSSSATTTSRYPRRRAA